MTDRDPKGRFTPGNQAAFGRPSRASERNYLQLMKDAITEDDWLKIVRKAVKDAIAGNSWARSWVSDYLIGKPPQILELKAAEAADLRDLLDVYKRLGINASDVFAAMVEEIAMEADGHESDSEAD